MHLINYSVVAKMASCTAPNICTETSSPIDKKMRWVKLMHRLMRRWGIKRKKIA